MMLLRWFSTEKSPSVPQKVFLWAHLLALRSRPIMDDSCRYSQNRSLIYFHLGGWLRWAPGLPCRMKGAQKTSILRVTTRIIHDRTTSKDQETSPKEDFLRYKGKLFCGKPPWRLHSTSSRWSEAPCATAASHSRRFL